MSRKISVEVVGDSRSLTRAFSTSTYQAKKFNREITHMGRGIASGTGLFRSFGRSLAFASGGFVAFEGVSAFLTASITAARDAAVAQRSLAAQMKTSGQSFALNREQIEKTARSYAKFGFNNDEVIASLTVLERGTGKISTALRLQGLAADIARAKGIDLSAAALTVAKVFGGQETALRRAVPGLSKTAHGYDLIREAQAKMAGQAVAGTTSAERFSAELHNTQEIIGNALLPTLNTYLDKLSKWMANTKNQAKLQRGVTESVKGTNAALKILGDSYTIAHAGASRYHRFAKFAERHTLGPFRRVVRDTLEPGALIGDVAGLFGGGKKGATIKGTLGGALGPVKAIIDALDLAVAAELKKPSKAAPGGPSGKLLSQWFDSRIGRMLDRVQDIPSLRGQLTRLRQIAAILAQRIAITKDITRKLDLEDQLVGVRRQERDISGQVAQQRAAARAAQITARQTRQFRLLGFGPGGEDLVPGAKGLAGQAKALSKALEGTFLDTDHTRSLMAHIRRILSGGLGAVGQDVRSKIASILADLKAQLKGNAVDVTRFRVDAKQFAGAGGRAVVITGPVHIHGVTNVKQLEEQLLKRAHQRQHPRRGAR